MMYQCIVNGDSRELFICNKRVVEIAKNIQEEYTYYILLTEGVFKNKKHIASVKL